MALVKFLETEQILAQGEDRHTALNSVGLCVFLGSVYKRLSRWDGGDEACLGEPHALCSF